MLLHAVRGGRGEGPIGELTTHERMVLAFALENFCNVRVVESLSLGMPEARNRAEADVALAATLREEVLDGESLRDIVLRHMGDQ